MASSATSVPLVCLLGCQHLAVAKGPLRACACLCASLCVFSCPCLNGCECQAQQAWWPNPKRGMLIMGKWERKPERTLVMRAVITQQTGRLFAPGLYLLFSLPSAPASCSLSLTMIKKCGPRGGTGKQRNAPEAHSREPTPPLAWTNKGFGICLQATYADYVE